MKLNLARAALTAVVGVALISGTGLDLPTAGYLLGATAVLGGGGVLAVAVHRIIRNP
ncbi:hypothetical protein GCM10010399_44010 [Dactylosporangium fulvum]|uniref:Secreted protein n=1 Tax=Dactylosporangium fulvum TaxID=53359 RepID=A0ABY5W8P6_9ACTN|nr:hypothetical protein [Dactylosporangium fulvum]UWP85932.1 hypothetical protein Dfulv_17435 [Dactylosporangium fulvum]